MGREHQSLWANVKVKNRDPNSVNEATRVFEMLQGFCHDPELSTMLAKYHLFETTLAERLDVAFAITIRVEELLVTHAFPNDEVFLTKLSHDALLQTMAILGTSNPTEAFLMMKERMDVKIQEPEFIPGVSTDLWVPLLNQELKASHKQALIEANQLARVNDKCLALDKDAGITFFGARKRDEFRIQVHNGTCYKSHHVLGGGMDTFSTNGFVSKHKVDYAAFTLNMLGEFSLFKHNRLIDRIAHSTMNAQDALVCAGEVKINSQGKIEVISSHSGHYRPELIQIYHLLRHLKHHGVVLDGITFCDFGKPPDALKDKCLAKHELFDYHDVAVYAVDAGKLYQYLDRLYHDAKVKNLTLTTDNQTKDPHPIAESSKPLIINNHHRLRWFQDLRHFDSGIIKHQFRHFKNAVIRGFLSQAYRSDIDAELRMAAQAQRFLTNLPEDGYTARERIELNAIYHLASRRLSHKSELVDILTDISKDLLQQRRMRPTNDSEDKSETTLEANTLKAFNHQLYKQKLEHTSTKYVKRAEIKFIDGVYQYKFYDQKNDTHTVFHFKASEITKLLTEFRLKTFIAEKGPAITAILRKKLGDALPWLINENTPITIIDGKIQIQDRDTQASILLSLNMAKSLLRYVDGFDCNVLFMLKIILEHKPESLLKPNENFEEIEKTSDGFNIHTSHANGQNKQQHLTNLEAFNIASQFETKFEHTKKQVLENESSICQFLSAHGARYGMPDDANIENIGAKDATFEFALTYKDALGYSEHLCLPAFEFMDALEDMRRLAPGSSMS